MVFDNIFRINLFGIVVSFAFNMFHDFQNAAKGRNANVLQ